MPPSQFPHRGELAVTSVPTPTHISSSSRVQFDELVKENTFTGKTLKLAGIDSLAGTDTTHSEIEMPLTRNTKVKKMLKDFGLREVSPKIV